MEFSHANTYAYVAVRAGLKKKTPQLESKTKKKRGWLGGWRRFAMILSGETETFRRAVFRIHIPIFLIVAILEKGDFFFYPYQTLSI